MAIAFVRSVQAGTSGGATSTIGFGVASTAGNTLILQVSTAIGRPTNGGDPYVSVTSNISGTVFTRATSASILQSGNYYEHSQIWVAPNVPAGTHTVTVNAGAGAEDYGQLFLIEFSGLANESVVDLTGNKIGDSTLGQFDTTINAGTTTQSEEIILAAFSAGGATNLSNYFTTEIVTPSGFTSIALDTDARLGHRALSHSYKIVNATGPQTVSWGTIADPGAGEKLVWAANVAALKAAPQLVVAGANLNVSTNLVSGSIVGVRNAPQDTILFSVNTTLVSGAASPQNITAVTGTILEANTQLIVGASTGVLSAQSVLVSGALVGQRNLTTNSFLFISGAQFAKANAAISSSIQTNTLIASASLTAGDIKAFNNPIVDGVIFNTVTLFGLSSDAIFTYPRAAVNGSVFARRTSLIDGSATAKNNGIPSGAVVSSQSAIISGTLVGSNNKIVSGALLVSNSSVVVGPVSAQLTQLIIRSTLTASSTPVFGSTSLTSISSVNGATLNSVASIFAGSTAPQISKQISGGLLVGSSSITPAVANVAFYGSVQSNVLSSITTFVSGSVVAQKNPVVNSFIFNVASSLTNNGITIKGISFVRGVTLGGSTQLIQPGIVVAKFASIAGVLFNSAVTFTSASASGAKSMAVPGQTVGASITYVSSVVSSVRTANVPATTLAVQPELLAGQSLAGIQARPEGIVMTSSASMAAGRIVYFAAVEAISQTISTQSNFMAGVAVGKQLTRRNTGGRAFYFLQEFLQPIVGQELIFSDQNGPRPAKPYATLSVRSISEQPIIEHHLNGGGIVSLAKLQRMIVEVEYFGLGAFSKAQVLGLKLESPSSVDRGQEFGISVSELRGVTRVPELLNQSQYEERGILEFTAYIMVEGDDDVGLIEHAIIQDTDADHACNFDFVYEGPN